MRDGILGRFIEMGPPADEHVRAGWQVTPEPVERMEVVVARLRNYTEEAWQDGDTAQAIRAAKRVLAAEIEIETARALHPMLIAHGPLAAWPLSIFALNDGFDAMMNEMALNVVRMNPMPPDAIYGGARGAGGDKLLDLAQLP